MTTDGEVNRVKQGLYAPVGSVIGVQNNYPPAPETPSASARPNIAFPPLFVGREREITALRGALLGARPSNDASGGAPAGAAAAIHGRSVHGFHGMGGIGKTALALHVAGLPEVRARFKAGQLIINLAGVAQEGQQPVEPAAAMRTLMQQCHPLARLPDDDASLANLYRQTFADAPYLLILDNAKDEAQVMPLLPPAPSAAIVTSRRRFSLPGVLIAELDLLSEPEAIRLARALCPRLEEASARDLSVTLCGRLPLAVEIVARAVDSSDRDVGSMLGELRDQKHRLETLAEYQSEAARDLVPVHASISWSFRLLGGDEIRGRFLELSIFPVDFDALAAAAVWREQEEMNKGPDAVGAARAQAQKHLDAIRRVGLLLKSAGTGSGGPAPQDPGRDRVGLHDLVRLWAAGELAGREDGQGRRTQLALRFAAHYGGLLALADRLYQSKDRHLAGLGLFDAEKVNIVAGFALLRGLRGDDRVAADRTLARQVDESIAEYVNAGVYVLDLRVPPRERIAWREAQRDACRGLGDRGGEGAALGNLGIAYFDLGDARKAVEYHEQHLVIAREIGDRRGEGATLGNLGNAYVALGDASKAVEYHEQALTISREIGDKLAEGATLGNLGIAYSNLGDAGKAVEYHEQRLVIAREIGDRRGEGATLGNLGLAYFDLGDARKAVEYHEQNLVIAREIGDRRGEGNALGNLGNAYFALGDARKAVEYHEQHLVIAREIGDRRGEGNALGNLGIAYFALGDARKAVEYHEQALTISREIGDKRAEGQDLGNLGIAYAALGDARKAVEMWGRAVELLDQIGDAAASASTRWNMGVVLARSGQPEQARPLLQAYVDFLRRIGHPQAEQRADAMNQHIGGG